MSANNKEDGFLGRALQSLQNMKLATFLKRTMWTVVALVIVAIALSFILVHYPSTMIPDVELASRTVYQDQGWTTDPLSKNRQRYYYTPQGTSIPPGSTNNALRYDWLVNLEKSWGKERLVDPQHMRALGFIVDEEPSPANPDQLPVGFSKHWNDTLGEDLVDLTCAACHTGNLTVLKDDKRVSLRIEGGSANHAILDLSLHQFSPVLLGSMVSTYFNPVKFGRFAKNVLKDHSAANKKELRQNFWSTLVALISQKQNSPFLGLYPVEEGYGRVDAIGRIANTVFGAHLDEKNFGLGNAPVSYPPVWDTWKFDWVQYTGSVKQPMARNMGEALGVGARLNLVDPYGRPLPADKRFTSSILVENLYEIEMTLQQLNPPQWDEELLGTIDREKAARGKTLFQNNCFACHGPHLASQKVKHAESPLKGDDDPEWRVKLIDVEQIGTDSTAADNFVDNRYDMSGTGISDQEAGKLLKPFLIRALRSKVVAEFDSPFLDEFLQQKDPRSKDLKRDTSWMESRSWTLAEFEKQFAHWYRYGAYDLEQSLSQSIDDDSAIELVRIEIVRKALEKIEQRIAAIDMSQVSTGEGLNYLGFILRAKYYADNKFSQAKQDCLDGFGTMDLPQVVRAYKARPLAGMWATPPFLHNGSVVSIYQLLSPVAERASEFYVGQNIYDPETLGFRLEDTDESGFLFDATIKGNYNTGHEFREGYVPYREGVTPQKGIIGPPLSHQDRMDLIEYLKVHQDPPTSPSRVVPSCESL